MIPARNLSEVIDDISGVTPGYIMPHGAAALPRLGPQS